MRSNASTASTPSKAARQKTRGLRPLASPPRYVFDTYAWVDYTTEGVGAARVAELLDSELELFTPASVLAELNEVLLRHGVALKRRADIMSYMKSRTEIVALDAALAESAGSVNFEHKKLIPGWGMLDSFIWAAALRLEAHLLTRDPHFLGLVGVEMLAKDDS